MGRGLLTRRAVQILAAAGGLLALLSEVGLVRLSLEQFHSVVIHPSTLVLLSSAGLLSILSTVLLWRWPRAAIWCLAAAVTISAVAVATARTRMFIYAAPQNALEAMFWALNSLVVADPAALPLLLLSAAALLFIIHRRRLAPRARPGPPRSA
jgi:hypothetical protein